MVLGLCIIWSLVVLVVWMLERLTSPFDNCEEILAFNVACAVVWFIGLVLIAPVGILLT